MSGPVYEISDQCFAYKFIQERKNVKLAKNIFNINLFFPFKTIICTQFILTLNTVTCYVRKNHSLSKMIIIIIIKSNNTQKFY